MQFADAIANWEVVELFGGGSQTRDFIHVSDVGRACDLAADHGLISVYNVGTQEAYTFNEMAAISGPTSTPSISDFPSTATATTHDRLLKILRSHRL